MRSFFAMAGLVLAILPLGAAQAASNQTTFVDPLNAAAIITSQPDQQPLIAVTQAGQNMVAVGPRGMIIDSDATANNWTQANVPVQSDLVAVQFIDANNGWACGHDGVILHSVDGGKTWKKQLDGISARASFEAYYNSRIAAGDNSVTNDLQEIQANFDPGPILPWMGVWFTTPSTGFVVGPFGDIAYTSDSGKTWMPWLDRIDNPNSYDLNAIGMAGDNLYIIGEQGSVYIFDKSQQKFVSRSTAYAGSLFGLVGDDKTLLVYGLRGNVFHSEDQGKTWAQSKNPSNSSIMDGTELPDGRFVLVTVQGSILVSSDGGVSFQPSATTEDAPLSGIAAQNHGVVITSLAGIRHVSGI